VVVQCHILREKFLPVGLCYDDEQGIVLDPDAQVRGAVCLVFRLFREAGSAYGVVQRFAAQGLRFPKRAYGRAWDGRLVWGHLTHARVLGVLKNPSYAGVYVFGRYQSRRTLSPQGEVHGHVQRVPQEEWRVNLENHHAGYISWEQYLENQRRLEKNRTNGQSVPSGPAREGLALLQGLLLCGRCGRRLTVRYTGTAIMVCWRRMRPCAPRSPRWPAHRQPSSLTQPSPRRWVEKGTTARRLATCGPCCSPGFTKCFPGPVSIAGPRCA
jgi:hypothetical protein